MALQLRSTKQDDMVVVHVHGELDIATAGELWSHLSGWIEAGEVRLLVDCADVTFLDCAGVTALVRGLRTVRTRGGWLLLHGITPQVFHLLRLIGLARVLVDEPDAHGSRGVSVGCS